MIHAAKNPVGTALVSQLIYGALTKHFNAVHVRWRAEDDVVAASALPRTEAEADAFRAVPTGPTQTVPTIYCPNHSNWFDGYLCMVLARSVFHHEQYLMMEEKNLARYRFFTWAGCFGVDRDDGRAAIASLDYAVGILRDHPERGMYIFPQGTMVPNERRPLRLYSGVARLAQRVGRVRVVPMAFRYEYLQEQRPDVFVTIGAGRLVAGGDAPRATTAWLGDAITSELDTLTLDVTAERLTAFTTVLRGKGGIDRTFDRLASRARRESRRLTHGG
ncbi:MAG: 1-acyl-sn-glycerol-3-phosphate acyltransferase [Ktedonobacterales bacterium]|nr:1-acyl-sn-glycerol-3-phosphate acyltransferase [Ktedonobacterales bacterium]